MKNIFLTLLSIISFYSYAADQMDIDKELKNVESRYWETTAEIKSRAIDVEMRYLQNKRIIQEQIESTTDRIAALEALENETYEARRALRQEHTRALQERDAYIATMLSEYRQRLASSRS